MPPLILLTNDDGVRAFGLDALAGALAALGELIVVAPASQRSAASHAITIDRPLRVRQVAASSFEVEGTPADAVFVALHELLPRTPDLLVSGINHGLNLGRDIFYSGTVAAAMEGAMKGIRALAVSQQLLADAADPASHAEQAELFHGAARFAAALASSVLAAPPTAGIALNVNCPARSTSEYRWTRAGDRIYGGEIVARVDPRGVPYYWIGGPTVDPDGPPGSDARAICEGAISVTPLAADFNAAWPQHRDRPAAQGFLRTPDLAHGATDARSA